MRFVCKSCGMITDNPEIVPHPTLNEKYWASEPLTSVPYNYSITCPVCQNETRFWREEPFPTDKEDNINLSTIPTRVI